MNTEQKPVEITETYKHEVEQNGTKITEIKILKSKSNDNSLLDHIKPLKMSNQK
ncbi:25939_t:CDS:2 [Dentiscutata erythropus]|uniref:25939_t:CDS:1 n=1 Tax=Dentiscutata erythropus TaxID=1348616 RepID=A0A9N9N7C6_9GLOM|nr:25939_t:CDS:2 [Dentiscutata erythropus]